MENWRGGRGSGNEERKTDGERRKDGVKKNGRWLESRQKAGRKGELRG